MIVIKPFKFFMVVGGVTVDYGKTTLLTTSFYICFLDHFENIIKHWVNDCCT